MSPLVKSGTGSFSKVLNAADAFYVYNKTTLYTYSSDTIFKYTLDAAGTTASLDYSFANPVPVPGTNNGMFAVEVEGVRYIVVSFYNSPTYSEIDRFTDTGSELNEYKKLTWDELAFKGPGYLSVSGSARGTCNDGFKNEDETDVDCGGSCFKCDLDKKCFVDNDCTSGVCASGTNLCAPSCIDGVKNQDESDIDCGGATCINCLIGNKCNSKTDCMSKNCNATKICDNPSCSDGSLNQDETDVDCGGPCGSTCLIGQICKVNSDCAGSNCTAGFCAASCTDGIKNNAETDVDCGGGSCTDCANNKACLVSSDCTSQYCNPNNKCSVPSCKDGFMNQDETDVDCGGNTCRTKCAFGDSCVKNSDCASNICFSDGDICVNAPVSVPFVKTPLAKTPNRKVSASGIIYALPPTLMVIGFLLIV